MFLRFWNCASPYSSVGELWTQFSKDYGLDTAPFDEVFHCSDLSSPIPFAGPTEQYDMRQLCLPEEYGTGGIDADFWNRFRSILEDKLTKLKWQGRFTPLVASITSGLMHDQSVFLLGAPGTGKSTLVSNAILPALRETLGTENTLNYSEFSLTPATTSADIFGFQGLDGNWIKGPFVREVMREYSVPGETKLEDQTSENQMLEEDLVPEESPAHLVFFDEANRIDIEALLSPVQSELDRMQHRKPVNPIAFGKDYYLLPKRVWRIFAGNSPAADIGRKAQSRPFKRRLSVVVPNDPMEEVIGNSSRFRSLCFDLLERSTEIDDIELSEPSLAFLGDLKSNQNRLDDLMTVLGALRQIPQVAVTVGLVESILHRAASHKALKQESPLDAALSQTLVGLVSGDLALIENLVAVAEQQDFSLLKNTISKNLIDIQQTDGRFELDPLL